MATPNVIEIEEDDICAICGEAGELRPYGSGGSRICFNCGMKDEDATEEGFVRFHDGEAN